MVKFLVFAILLASSTASGLVETLFRTENGCYTGCHANYAAIASYLDACQKGCDLKLHQEDCANQCKSIFMDEKIQMSCQVGCTLSRPDDEGDDNRERVISIDPVPAVEEPQITPVNPEPEKPRSIILIRLRQRPIVDMPTVDQVMNSDPIQMFNDIVRRFQEKINSIEQSNGLPSGNPVSELIKSVPIVPPPGPMMNRMPGHMMGDERADSSSESSEESDFEKTVSDRLKQFIEHAKKSHEVMDKNVRPIGHRFRELFHNVRSRWNNHLQNQSGVPVWIVLSILLSSSVLLWYMLISLCRHAPSRNLSIRAQELVFHPYDYDAYEKEKIQPEDPVYEATESVPIKVKLSSI